MQLILTPDNPAPPGGIASTIRAADGMSLRVARWHPEGAPRGVVVICAGRAEFIEKYFETATELLARQMIVVAFDWRGQGLSGRELDNSRKSHIDDFSLYERDLDALVEQVLAPFCPKPWFALGHSMGGAILIAQARGGRSPFDRLAVIAPMIDIHGLPFPRALRLLVEALDTLGFGGAVLPRRGPGPRPSTVFQGNRLTSDERRFQRSLDVAAASPSLSVGAPTIGWLNAAFRQMKQFANPEYPRRVPTPALVFAAGADQIIDAIAVERFATRLKAGKLIEIPHARHEILMERDVFREQFWSAFDAFIPGARDELSALEMAREAIERARQPTVR